MATRFATALIYVAPGKALTATAIRTAVGIRERTVSVRVLAVPAALEAPPEGAVLVLDLTGAMATVRPPATRMLRNGQVILAVGQDDAIPASWLDVVREPSVRVMRVRPHSEAIHPRVAEALRTSLSGLRKELSRAVLLQLGSRLPDLEAAVQAIIDDPWGIRKPAELASAMSLSLDDLERRMASGATPVRRVEHAITLVRWLAFEHLTGQLGVRGKRALSMVGIRDRSNLRRQWRRAKYLLGT